MDGVRRICVFCGASSGLDPAHAAAAREAAREIVGRRFGVVYGGGRTGLMGTLADATLDLGGEVIGVIPRRLVDREVAHAGVTRLDLVDTLHERKARMSELSVAFIALPGGLGTLEELAEVLSWAQLELHDKPVGLLNVGGYFDLLVDFLDHAVDEGFLRPEHRALLVVDADPARLLERIVGRLPPEPG
jgi:uncharacterized protein (TIGR00730 family)